MNIEGMKHMKTKKAKNALKKHEYKPNQLPQNRGAQKRIHRLNNRQRPITPGASEGKVKQTLAA